VLFAEVNANGTLANQCSGCSVTIIQLAVGNYEADFAQRYWAEVETRELSAGGRGRTANAALPQKTTAYRLVSQIGAQPR
jgi:hypothetical protein